MKPKLYRVKAWEHHFEGAKSKTYNNKTSCTMPTKHGLGYRRLITSKNGPAMFGAWCAIVQILSRQPKTRSGWLTDDGTENGKPYTANDIELITGIPEKIVSDLLSVAISQDVGWMVVMEAGDSGLTDKEPCGYHKEPRYPLNSDLDSDLDSDTNPQKRAFGEFENVMLTDEEHAKLVAIHGEEGTGMGIDALGAWMKRTGKRRKDHYACMDRTSFVWEKINPAKPIRKGDCI